MIATMIYQCMRGATVAGIKAAGMDGFFTLHDCGLFPCDPNGVPFTTAYIACTGDPVADLTEDMAAEQKARATYEHLITLSDDPEVKKPLIFLREREVVHFQRFGEALNIVQENIASKKKTYNNMYRGKANRSGNMCADAMNMRGSNRMYDNMCTDRMNMCGDKMNGNMYAGGMNADACGNCG
jgi:Mn-containing catalase